MSLSLAVKKIYNHALSEIKSVIYLNSADRSEIQVVALHPDIAVPVSTPQAVTESTVDVNSSSPTLILAANTSRKGGFLVNRSDVNVYISTDSGMTDGFLIYPNGVFQLTLNYGGIVATNAIYGLAVSGSGKTIRYWVA